MSATLTPPPILMTQVPAIVPSQAAPGLYRFTVEQCEAMIAAGIFGDNTRVELIEGLFWVKDMDNSPHATACLLLFQGLASVLPSGWHPRPERVLVLGAGVPVPDTSVVRGSIRDYAGRHPTAAETRLVAEVADSSLPRDRNAKQALYAAARIPVYWILNLDDRTVEVRTRPRGTGDTADYADLQVYGSTERVPVVLDGVTVGTVAVADLLP